MQVTALHLICVHLSICSEQQNPAPLAETHLLNSILCTCVILPSNLRAAAANCFTSMPASENKRRRVQLES